MPLGSRDLLRAARQRLTAAEHLLRHRYTLEAMYLAGYTIEFSLRALILKCTSEPKRPEILKKIASGGKMHNPYAPVGRPIFVMKRSERIPEKRGAFSGPPSWFTIG